MAGNPDESRITVPGLIKSLTETQNLVVLVFSFVSSTIAVFQTWDQSKMIAAIIAGAIVLGAFGWIFYRESKKKKAELPGEVTDSAFIGLNSFEGKDRDHFFGRGSETGELLRMVSRNDFRFGVLSGESCSGKTSLLNAGLIPKLAEQGCLAVYLRLLNDPDTVIRKAVGKASKIDAKQDEALKEYLARASTATGSTLVLCCDQFEEFFIHFPTADSRDPFMTFVSACIRDADLAVKFLFTLREDFLSRIHKFTHYIDEPLSTTKVFTLENFDTGQAAEIIERSARRVSLPFQTGLSGRVAEDLAVNGRVLPTELQIVCLQMQRRHIYDEEQYEQTGAKEALVHSYLEDVVRLSGSDQDVIPVLRSLISEDNTKLALTLREISERTQKKEDIVRDILNSFVQARLLREVQDQEPWRYEFTHEYLIARVNEISGSITDEVKKANYAFRHYLEQYAVDPNTRIPLRKAPQIRRFSDLKRNAREKELLDKSLRAGWLVVGMAWLAFFGLSGTAFKFFMDQQNTRYRIENRIGVLAIDDAKKGRMILKRIQHYLDNQKYPAEKLKLDGNTIDLPGSADYMLTDNSETPALQYPVHIEGLDDRVEVKLVSRPDNIPSGMVFIPPGEFRMGDKDNKDGVDFDAKPHDVRLDGFLMDITEVSNEAYRKFIEAGGYGSKDPGGRALWSDEEFNRNDHPVVGVSWYEAEAYCQFMGKQLPTEAQWEKAARGPEGYQWSFGNDSDELDAKANGSGDEDGYETTAPVIVEKYGVNGYGLYQMSGNVWEWVQDFYDAGFYDREGAETNPVNNTAANIKIVRGGSWNNHPENLRPPASRHSTEAGSTLSPARRCPAAPAQ
ncbi:MAG: formylglycine-generating enzyme family protein [Methylococcaceae bacterium]|nr:formylglycine-generating enzyme family protein [Methylococcaceae bacterium]